MRSFFFSSFFTAATAVPMVIPNGSFSVKTARDIDLTRRVRLPVPVCRYTVPRAMWAKRSSRRGTLQNYLYEFSDAILGYYWRQKAPTHVRKCKRHAMFGSDTDEALDSAREKKENITSVGRANHAQILSPGE
ncbi:hypothetical protein PUN28_008556 [Cardiocondyla obscurior]|uniref:Secreted protein n=1 Tax=Cardiocondyla obscurior TaxID=286306 RepID=A0AAW2G480_9HYME